jgi:hypothetical protein
MRRWPLVAVTLVAIVVGVVLALDMLGGRHVDETRRVRNHLAGVSRALRVAPPSWLTAEQGKARATTLDWLDEYRERGVFPHNHVVEGRRVPVFVDPHGTPCAVGYLLLRSGEHDLVEEIVRTDNLVRVPQLRDDPRVASWLARRGITLEEAAWIQPQYGPEPPPDDPRRPDDDRRGYGVATVGASVVSAAMASYTAAVGRDAGAPWVDLLSFGTTMGHAYVLAERDEADPGWTTWVNVGGLAVSVRTLIARMTYRGDASPDGGGRHTRARLHPFVRPALGRTELGVVLRH